MGQAQVVVVGGGVGGLATALAYPPPEVDGPTRDELLAAVAAVDGTTTQLIGGRSTGANA